MNLSDRKEQLYLETVQLVLKNKYAHCTTVMVSESRLNDLKRMFVCAAVPYNGDGKCFMFCKS
ncbi:MAG: hypothetical protein ACRC6V_09350 [Bacteroidales bacterium]